ncbi:hypothetical protein [Halohasta salina]|uniref:hypothetical protein n=1 Tax=Halohasta salina TaxID=2961621 RepID=UPI0020A23DBC|nr:hypothetical protein [Halohasta salina]
MFLEHGREIAGGTVGWFVLAIVLLEIGQLWMIQVWFAITAIAAIGTFAKLIGLDISI